MKKICGWNKDKNDTCEWQFFVAMTNGGVASVFSWLATQHIICQHKVINVFRAAVIADDDDATDSIIQKNEFTKITQQYIAIKSASSNMLKNFCIFSF